MSQGGTRMLLIDAISESGMAGGPVTFTHDRNGKPHIAGVIVDPDAGRGRTSPVVVRTPARHHPGGLDRSVKETIDGAKRR